MPEETTTLRDKFNDLTKKVDKLAHRCAELDGQKKALAKEREGCYEQLRELGVKNPEDQAKLKKHIRIRKKKLDKAMDKKISEVEAALDKLKEEE